MKTFFCYTRCSTCRKAKQWLIDNGVKFSERSIVEQNPTAKELTKWIKTSGLPVSKFFNTSGILYRAENVKDKVRVLPDNELIDLLATNGMLVKRPILVDDDVVLVGFNEKNWAEKLL
ncbi:MAG: arsenate reductase family protein [Prevotellaceae bacterium]|jgi:arsenate reductase|nr:arsenate reductase family protein [Prevotellaceae bacterium]